MVVLCDEFTPGLRLVDKPLSGTLPVTAVHCMLTPKSFCQETLPHPSHLHLHFNGQAWCPGGGELEISPGSSRKHE